jgi:hypothetical protein
MGIDEHGLVLALTIAFVLEVAVTLWALWGIIRVYREVGGSDSFAFKGLLVQDIIVVVIQIMLLPVAFGVLLDLPQLPFTGLAISLSVIVLGSVVIWHRLGIWRITAKGQVDLTEETRHDAPNEMIESE